MIGRPLLRLDEVTSTQEVTFALASAGAKEGTTVRTAYQNSGRGRAGRAWSVPSGEALLFSVLLRPELPPARLAPFSILTGEAIASVFIEEFHLTPSVKWPNDVLVNGRKVAGILIQTRLDRSGPIAVVGIGINVRSSHDDLPPGATSLAAELGMAIDQDRLFSALLAAIGRRYHALVASDIGPYMANANNLLWLNGEDVTIDDAGRLVAGRVVGLGEDGSLLLETAGETLRIVSGEMTRGPRPLGARSATLDGNPN